MLVGLTILICAALSRLVEGRWLSAPLLLSASLLGPLLIFSIPVSSFTTVVLILATACFCISYFTLSLISKARCLNTTISSQVSIPFRELAVIARAFFVFGQLAFAVNLFRVLSSLGPTAYLTASSKQIELSFGASSVINYIFFLNISAACIFSYLLAQRRVGRVSAMLMIWAIVSLGFTGIKSTMIFGTCMAVLVYMLVRRPGVGWLLLIASAMSVVIVALFIAVNISPSALWELGSDVNLSERLFVLFRGYVYDNYLNLDMELALRDTYMYGKYTFFFISKLLDPNLVGYADTTDFLVVDPAFNMGTLLREYFVDFGVPGALLVPFILGGLTASISNSWRVNANPRYAITLSVLMTACLFSFFGNQFVRLQFLFVIFTACAADLLALGLHKQVGELHGQATSRPTPCAA